MAFQSLYLYFCLHYMYDYEGINNLNSVLDYWLCPSLVFVESV